ncbi:MAG: nudF [Verrucomicrobiaceae bacterium]|nr:nudF [Verrucomicrobiaceae bacterium]
MSSGGEQFELVRVEDGQGWKKAGGTMLYESDHVQVEDVQCITPTRPDASTSWTIVHRKAAVAIAPMLEDGRFVLIHQERIPVHRTLWEFPAGQIDVPANEVTHDIVIRTAITELREETGGELLPGGKLRPLGHFFPSQGFTQEHVYLFLARPVHLPGAASPQHDERFGEMKFVTAAELRLMIARNEITTALTLALYAKLAALGLLAD